MSKTDYDFVLVGAGSNTLTAAAYLAAGGHSVLVLERKDYIGGGCVSREVTLPGFKHDLHATNVFLVKANPLIRCDELGLLSRFGLEYIKTDEAYHGSLFNDGTGIRTYTDLDRTADDLAKISPADGRAYREFAARAMSVIDLISWGMFSPPPNPAVFLELLGESEQGQYLLSLMQASAWDVIRNTFVDSRTQSHLYRMTSEMMVSPEEPGTAFALFLILGFSHRYTSGFVKGGSQGFSDALAACIRHHGGEIRINSDVKHLHVEGGRIRSVECADGSVFRAKEAVIAGIPPWDLGGFIKDFSPGLLAAAKRARPSDFAVFLSSYALNSPIEPRYPEGYRAIQINQCCDTDINKLRRAISDAKNGRLAQDYYANFICASQHDSTRAPSGKATLYLYHMVPMIPEGGTLETWEGMTAPFAKWLLEGARNYVGNLEDSNILGAHHESPLDMDRCSPSFRNGDVMGLGTFADQFIGGRPIADFSQFRVPGIKDLYLCGPFMHPGGGVTGGGRAVAMRVMHDRGMDLDRAFPFH